MRADKEARSGVAGEVHGAVSPETATGKRGPPPSCVACSSVQRCRPRLIELQKPDRSLLRNPAALLVWVQVDRAVQATILDRERGRPAGPLVWVQADRPVRQATLDRERERPVASLVRIQADRSVRQATTLDREELRKRDFTLVRMMTATPRNQGSKMLCANRKKQLVANLRALCVRILATS